MTSFGPYALFWVTAASHLLITAYAMFRSRQRAALPTEEKDNFSTTAMAQITPESASLDPRAPQYPEDEAELEKGAGI